MNAMSWIATGVFAVGAGILALLTYRYVCEWRALYRPKPPRHPEDLRQVTPGSRCEDCGGYATKLKRIGGQAAGLMSGHATGGRLVCADTATCKATRALLKSLL